MEPDLPTARVRFINASALIADAIWFQLSGRVPALGPIEWSRYRECYKKSKAGTRGQASLRRLE